MKQQAQSRNITVSAIIRLIIEEKFRAKPKKSVQKHESLLEAARRVNKLGPKGPPDLATNLDKYLYGGK